MDKPLNTPWKAPFGLLRRQQRERPGITRFLQRPGARCMWIGVLQATWKGIRIGYRERVAKDIKANKDASRIRATVSIFNLVGHNDDEIARPMALKLARELNRLVVVILGVHVSRATKDDVGRLLENTNLVSENLVKLLRRTCK